MSRPSYLDKLQRPWATLVAAVYGCNFSCWFCGIQNSFDPKNWHRYRFIDPNLVGKVFEEMARWNPGVRVEFDIRGDASLHPKLDEVFRATRVDHKAFLQCHTNGSLLEEWDAFDSLLTSWFASGLNMLVLNSYRRWWGAPKPMSKYELWKVYTSRYQSAYPEIRVVDYYYDDPETRVSPHHYGDPRSKTIVIMDDIERMNEIAYGRNKRWHGQVGNLPIKFMTKLGIDVVQEPLQSRCTRPFREMDLEVDGHVTTCCLDWRRQMILGKFPEASMQEIWEGEAWCAVRELIWRKNRHMSPCNKCEVGGTRTGLLKPIDMPGTEQELLQIVERNARRYAHATHPGAELRVGNVEIKPERPGVF